MLGHVKWPTKAKFRVYTSYMLPWFERASCLDMDPELFFDNVPERAKKICKNCEVRLECLAEALLQDTDGVFGGTTKEDRRRMKAMLSAISFSSDALTNIQPQQVQQVDLGRVENL